MDKFGKAWFINFNGIGNGIIISPILKCFENSNPHIKYFHTDNQILANLWFSQKAGLKNLIGFSQLSWRRFNPNDYEEINSFILNNRINLIINVRNEGPKYDIGYYDFKRSHCQNSKLSFWDLDFSDIENRTSQLNLSADIINLLKQYGVDFTSYNSTWLNGVKKIIANNTVGFGMAASQTNKRWSVKKWIKVGRKLLEKQINKIIIIGGNSVQEVKESTEVLKELNSKQCELIIHRSIEEISEILGELQCFISNDTGLLHIAVAIGTPTVGIYTNTNPDVWGHCDKKNFIALQNQNMNRCDALKLHSGNCFHYYDICPAIEKYPDTVEIYSVLNAYQFLSTNF